MMVRKFLLLCLFFETCASSLLAMEPAEIKEWTPARLHEPKVLKNISELIKKEKHECVINSLDESRKDYGFSRAGVHALQKTLLTKVKTSYEKNKAEQRPFFLDLGAGHGYMSWKAAVAGAYVVSVEKQEPTAQLMCQNMAKAKPFLAPRESVKNICKLYPGDVLDFTKPYYNNLYDFVWAGYLIHFLKPTQAKSLISTLFKSMKEEAWIGMTVNAPASHPSIVEVYNNQKQAGNSAPGYMVLDKYIYREFNENTKEDKNIKIEIVGSHSIIETSNKTEDYPPAYEFHGHYGQKEEKPRLEFHEQKGKSIIRKRKAHVALHFTGPDELRTLFEGNGFVVEDIYYLSNSGKSVPIEEMTQDLLKKQPQILCILARKPQGN